MMPNDLKENFKKDEFYKTAAVLHNIRTIRNSEVAEGLFDHLNERQSIIN